MTAEPAVGVLRGAARGSFGGGPVTRVRQHLFALAILAVLAPSPGSAEPIGSPAPPPAPPLAFPPALPQYGWGLDLPLVIWGVGGTFYGKSISVDKLAVPDEGLDPTGIRFAFDQNSIGDKGTQADSRSSSLRNACLLFPFALRMTTSPGSERLGATAHSFLLTGESVLFSEAITEIVKRARSRPRPFNYLPASDRPDDPQYDVTADRAFESFPSGHATSAWAAVACGLTDNMLARPNCGGGELIAVGFLGGALASATGSLRVEAGQHFPTDVIAGSAIGIASGVTIPLLHRYVSRGVNAPYPSRGAWVRTAGGTIAGAFAGLFLADALGG